MKNFKFILALLLSSQLCFGSYVVQNHSVTQIKLAARATGTTVAAGGVAISASCGGFLTNSTTYVDVTNLTVTITTTGRPVFISIISDSSGTQPALLSVPAGSNAMSTLFLRGATNVGEYFLISPGGTGSISIPSSISTIDFPAAGTYTYKVQEKVNVSANGGLNFSKLIVFEL